MLQTRLVGEKQGMVGIGAREGGVGSIAKEGKGHSFFNFCSRTFVLIRLTPLMFLVVVGICLGCQILGLKRSSLIFLPLFSN